MVFGLLDSSCICICVLAGFSSFQSLEWPLFALPSANINSKFARTNILSS